LRDRPGTPTGRAPSRSPAQAVPGAPPTARESSKPGTSTHRGTADGWRRSGHVQRTGRGPGCRRPDQPSPPLADVTYDHLASAVGRRVPGGTRARCPRTRFGPPPAVSTASATKASSRLGLGGGGGSTTVPKSSLGGCQTSQDDPGRCRSGPDAVHQGPGGFLFFFFFVSIASGSRPGPSTR